MRSKTKTIVTDDQVRTLVKKNFGKDIGLDKITELKGGMCNSAYLLEFSENGALRSAGLPSRMVLKVSMRPDAPLLSHEGDNMVAELEAYRLVGERTDIPIPKVYCSDFTRSLIPCRYFFMEYLSGRTLIDAVKEIPPDNLTRIKARLADYLAQLHAIRGTYFGYITNKKERRYGSWRTAYETLMGMIIEDGRKRKITLPEKRIALAIAKNIHHLDAVVEPRLIHNDFFAGNVFVRKIEDEYEIEAVMDFERASWADPLAEFHFNLKIAEDIWEDDAFWRNYREREGYRPLTEAEIARVHLYKLYLFTIMIAETYRYGFIYARFQRMFSRSFLDKSLKALLK